ncbi:MAG: VOC family protein [bacterium]|nr:VOC family protein [bacterium]
MGEGATRALFVIYVADQERSRDFYRAVLGVDPTLDVPGMTEFPLLDGSSLGLMPVEGIVRLLGDTITNPATAAGVPRSELYLVVHNASAYHDRAIAVGAEELSPLLERTWGDRVVYSQDLDGHILAFAEQTSGGGEVPVDCG